MQKFDTVFTQMRNRRNHIIGCHCQMLHARPTIKIKVFFHLRFLFSFGGFVNRKLDSSIAIRHYFAHQCCIFSRNIFVVKTYELIEPHYFSVKIYPFVHAIPTYISYNVVNVFQTNWRWMISWFPSSKIWQKNAFIFASLYKNMHSIAISMNARTNNFSILIFFCNWFKKWFCTTRNRFVVSI